MGQQEPGFLNVRIYSAPSTILQVDLTKLRHDVSAKRPGQHLIFDVRLVVVEPDGSSARAYLIRWSRHENEPAVLQLTDVELQPMLCQLPEGLNLAQLAAQLSTDV